MQRALLSAAVAGLAVASSTAFAAETKTDVKSGQWQTTIKIEMPGMPFALPPVTTETCITEKDLVPQTSKAGEECKLLSQKVSGSTVEWTTECRTAQGKMTGTGKITYTGDTYDGAMEMTTEGMQMKYKMTGKRLGDCKKAK